MRRDEQAVRATATAESEAMSFFEAVDALRNGGEADALASRIYAQLDADERLALLHGDTPFWEGRGEIMDHGYNHRPYVMGSNARLGIPGIRFIDGPRGVVVGKATAFPVSMARGASWNVALEQEIGRAIGLEVRASGGNFFGGVCINLPRHPAWGRIQETYSDQSVLIGAMGAALVRGTKPNAMPCIKHYALNSMENARFDVDVKCDQDTMQEDYLPHFKRAMEAGAASVMCAYNRVNGDWASDSENLLTEILRDQWGFDGFVISDFVWAIRDAAKSLKAGLDLEAPFAQLRADRLPAALENGAADWDMVETAARRLIATQLRHFAGRDTDEPGTDIIASPAHRALSRRAAVKSMVLLRNETVEGRPVLPFDAASLASIAVVGRLSDLQNTGDKGSSNVHAAHVVTPLEGIRAALPGAKIYHADGSDAAQAAALAAKASVAVVVVGYTAAEEGEWVNGRIYGRDDLMKLYPAPESDADHAVLDTMMDRLKAAEGKPEIGGDRKKLGLLPEAVALIRKVRAANPRTVVVVQTAGAVMMADWHEDAPALVLGWYAGMEGGHAIADLLLGRENFAGRLPYAIARSEADLPYFDAAATEITYDRWYGQRRIAHEGKTALYPLGFGLSYTSFAIESVSVTAGDETAATVSVTVANTGDRAGQANIQIYGTRLDGERAGERELIGFAVLDLAAGQTARTTVITTLQPLMRFDAAKSCFHLPAGEIRIEAARFWGDPEAAETSI
ncbi:glycoside hydrolase family 3 C-terminal domain-containing protein [Martelella sp. HB161492]|uniref:glycoside hydrolase family 3 protein n=1 Tax=Martelella sp. HB161492 TaxID=2720726 RepID=UPI001AEE4687|nr:glycoside hydrolase family 3 C-terminal domain-containing protein [Martelella sp. HB161492]